MNVYLFRSGDPIINKINDLPNPPILNYTSYKYKEIYEKGTSKLQLNYTTNLIVINLSIRRISFYSNN